MSQLPDVLTEACAVPGVTYRGSSMTDTPWSLAFTSLAIFRGLVLPVFTDQERRRRFTLESANGFLVRWIGR
jgi:hypothetical protein